MYSFFHNRSPDNRCRPTKSNDSRNHAWLASHCRDLNLTRFNISLHWHSSYQRFALQLMWYAISVSMLAGACCKWKVRPSLTSFKMLTLTPTLIIYTAGKSEVVRCSTCRLGTNLQRATAIYEQIEQYIGRPLLAMAHGHVHHACHCERIMCTGVQCSNIATNPENTLQVEFDPCRKWHQSNQHS